MFAALNVIMSIVEEFEYFLSEASDICSHISVREDDDGPYILALGLQEFHTLQIRHFNGVYKLELWRGTSENESVVSEPSYDKGSDAFSCAKEWLLHDRI